MTASELRIGNIVQYNNENKSTGTITALISYFVPELDYCFIDYRQNKKHWLINIEPIPLTEEWILKFGFTYNETTECYRYCNFILNKSFVMQDIDMRVCLKFVHQLQNLYFGLKGKELTIKK